ncbi:MAG: hypothetical protein L0Z48_02370 [candidate division Zixibacteria bacterium]|nr:hypothetical protein [candidate division Zixibacteria bacterium]MCI0595367.1 hypothetical protein [candidate division Zixibacteria bacterium]
MKRFFVFYLFLFRTRLARAFGCVVLAVALAAAYIGQRVKTYSLLEETAALEAEKQKREENIAYLEEAVARATSVETLEPKAFALGLEYPRLSQLARLPLFTVPEENLWRKTLDDRGVLARIRQNFPFKEAVVAAREFKNGK